MRFGLRGPGGFPYHPFAFSGAERRACRRNQAVPATRRPHHHTTGPELIAILVARAWLAGALVPAVQLDKSALDRHTARSASLSCATG